MQDIIVLGLVPGTNIQISFVFWLICSIAAAVILFAALKRYVLRAWILAGYVSYLVMRHHPMA